ncbi:serine/threonine-protein kinase [Chlorogloeopsis sp. ULAP01]|uniref:serine/threonine-protein kinase n=1 Tax=Chlorogloeopsis sp. ULAP01 TaxID=3056483 RepID=UPI0025AB0D25|nr:serine/threonine-protein kinase [Chlorogloeopsis sp. ULAP01]MDM9382929.1 serine/threonine-protein kinase [Chlorogloeopsis sp. ULAP01]
MSNKSAVHCINPNCLRPYPQPWGNKFCNSCGAPLELIDRYVPMARLGSGGFAQIYTVWDQKTQTEKVLKVLVEDSPKALELFAQEAAVLSCLRHPGVPKIDTDGYFQRYWSDSQGQLNLPCLVMEKIDGQTLENILQNYYPQGCPQELVFNWLTQAADILEHLHQRNIIHRDIKPSNLMLRNPSPIAGEQLVLIDFGGAKQFEKTNISSESRSTKLFSSGYSPPEQIAGVNIGPAADFYALGRTMIELLTGKHPADLEDPLTGEFSWRRQANVNPVFADLLDEMVSEDARSRPANTAILQRRLAQISDAFSSNVGQTSRHITPPVRTTAPAPISTFFWELEKTLQQAFTSSTNIVRKIIVFIFRAIVQLIRACLDTIWSMFLTCIGAGIGTIIGYFFAYRTTWGAEVGEVLSEQLTVLLANNQSILGSEILIFAGAGFGTAWGLTVAGGYGQRRRFLVASLMGMISYSFGWFILQLFTPKDNGEGLVGLILAAVSLFILGLGLRSHQIVHAVIAAFGTAIPFALLMSLKLSSNLFDLFRPTNNWEELWLKIAFFGLIGIFISFWLGVSYYLIVPGLRLLGWRK